MNKQLRMFIMVFSLLLFANVAEAAHRVLLFNENAMNRVLDMWPDFVESVNNQSRGMESPGERGIITQAPLNSHLNDLLREQPTPIQYGEGFKRLVKDHFHPAGRTAFGSRLNTNQQVTAYHYMLRTDGRLPIRFAYSYDLARQPIAEVSAAALYETVGVMWDTIEANPWMWLHGMSSEGDWDAPNRGCQGDDLPAKPGIDASQVKEVLEICPDFNSATVQALMRGVRSGWRFAGVHGIGSHGLRLFIQKLEEHMERNPKLLTLEYVRNSRHGFAHGTLTGAVPDVVEGLLKYNLYLPVDAARSLAIEPDNIRQNYGEPGWAFLAPVKTLLDAGVKVVGEAEVVETNPVTYFGKIDVYVNREIAKDGGVMPPATYGEGDIYVPEEGIDRVVALKLFTHRSSEFLYAETKLGSLEVGKFADFIVSDKPFLSGPDTEIRDNKVVLTVQAGEIVYQDNAYQPVVR